MKVSHVCCRRSTTFVGLTVRPKLRLPLAMAGQRTQLIHARWHLACDQRRPALPANSGLEYRSGPQGNGGMAAPADQNLAAVLRTNSRRRRAWRRWCWQNATSCLFLERTIKGVTLLVRHHTNIVGQKGYEKFLINHFPHQETVRITQILDRRQIFNKSDRQSCYKLVLLSLSCIFHNDTPLDSSSRANDLTARG
jgi:hypothetical protein